MESKQTGRAARMFEGDILLDDLGGQTGPVENSRPFGLRVMTTARAVAVEIGKHSHRAQAAFVVGIGLASRHHCEGGPLIHHEITEQTLGDIIVEFQRRYVLEPGILDMSV
jgi:hypothetical protein